jgi:hypothetical protein
MKKTDAIEILFKRQEELNRKADEFRIERDRLKQRLVRAENTIESAELESQAIKDLLIDHISLKNIKVKLRIVEEFTHVRAKRLMLEIQIGGVEEPLYKLLSGYEIELLERCNNIEGKLVLEARLKKMAKDFLNVHQILPDSRGYELNSSTVLDEYIGKYHFKSKMENVRNYLNRERIE